MKIDALVMLFGSMVGAYLLLPKSFFKALGKGAPLAYMMVVGMFYTTVDILLVISDAITAGNRAMLGLLLKTAVAGLVTLAVYLLPDNDRNLSEGETVLALMLMTGFFYMITDILVDLLLFLAHILG